MMKTEQLLKGAGYEFSLATDKSRVRGVSLHSSAVVTPGNTAAWLVPQVVFPIQQHIRVFCFAGRPPPIDVFSDRFAIFIFRERGVCEESPCLCLLVNEVGCV